MTRDHFLGVNPFSSKPGINLTFADIYRPPNKRTTLVVPCGEIEVSFRFQTKKEGILAEQRYSALFKQDINDINSCDSCPAVK